MQIPGIPFALAVPAVLAGAAQAAIVIDTTPANNQANLSSQAGQTFTTPALGGANLLSSIAVQGPQNFFAEDPTGPFTLKVFEDTDGDFATWDPGAEIASSTNTIPIDTPDELYEFAFGNEVLADDTVYAFSFNDGSTDHAAFRAGLTDASGVAISDGALFDGGSQPFGGAFDTSFQLETVPEPGVAVLAGFAGMALLRRRRQA